MTESVRDLKNAMASEIMKKTTRSERRTCSIRALEWLLLSPLRVIRGGRARSSKRTRNLLDREDLRDFLRFQLGAVSVLRLIVMCHVTASMSI